MSTPTGLFVNHLPKRSGQACLHSSAAQIGIWLWRGHTMMLDRATRARVTQKGWLVAALLSAALLPLLVNISLQAAFSAKTNRASFEAGSLEQARHLITSVDARLERTRGAAAALATTKSIRTGDWATAYSRAKEIAEQNPDWGAVILWDYERNVEIFDTRYPLQRGRPRRNLGFGGQFLLHPGDLLVSNVVTHGKDCPCLYAHAASGANTPLVLTVKLNASSFQRVVDKEGRGLSAIYLLDSAGALVAHTPTNPNLRSVAVARRQALTNLGLSGSYRGKDVAGDSYYVYARSPWTGWSVHLAFPPAAVDRSYFRGMGASAIAIIASLAIALLMAVVTLRAFRAQRELDHQQLQAVRREAVEQSSVARDLHDGLLQFLTSTLYRTEEIKRTLREGPVEKPIRALEELQADIRVEQREVRRFIENLGPELASKLHGSISEVRTALARRWDVEIELVPHDADDLVPDTLRRDIEFLMREAVSNAVRHGSATKIIISLAAPRGKIMMTIMDNGVRPAPEEKYGEAQKARKLVWPVSISGRVSQRKGFLTVEEGAAGTTLNIELPSVA